MLDTRGALPKIAPLRGGGSAVGVMGDSNGLTEMVHVLEQDPDLGRHLPTGARSTAYQRRSHGDFGSSRSSIVSKR
jgi:hypothetical protein